MIPPNKHDRNKSNEDKSDIIKNRFLVMQSIWVRRLTGLLTLQVKLKKNDPHLDVSWAHI